MTHARVRGRLSAYLEAELTARDAQAMEAHLIECALCAAELRALRRAVELLRGLPMPESPPDLGAAVLARLHAGEGAPEHGIAGRLPRLRSPLLRVAPLALAAGLGTLGIFSLLGGSRLSIEPVERLDGASRSANPERRSVRHAEAAHMSVVARRAAPRRAAVAPFPLCVERAREGEAPAAACAVWDAWLISMAIEDAPRFSREVSGLAPTHQYRVMRRLTDFAMRSGSAPLVSERLRRTRDPGAARMAIGFEGGNVRPVSLAGR